MRLGPAAVAKIRQFLPEVVGDTFAYVAGVARTGARAVIDGRVAWRLRVEAVADSVIAFRDLRQADLRQFKFTTIAVRRRP